jgi:hypothetical protein
MSWNKQQGKTKEKRASTLSTQKMINNLSPKPQEKCPFTCQNPFTATLTFLTCEKKNIVIPLPKPGKPSDDANSYTPISLTSCFSKIFEMINPTEVDITPVKTHYFS